MRPAETIDQQYDLARWWNTDGGFNVAVNYLLSIDGVDRPAWYAFSPLQQQHYRSRAEQITDMQKTVLLSAETFWVSADMVALSSHASQSMPPQPLRATDLPTPRGFMWLEQPVLVKDASRGNVRVRAVVWTTAGEGEFGAWNPHGRDLGLSVAIYGEMEPDHPFLVALREAKIDTPQLLFFTAQPWEFGQDYTRADTTPFYGNPTQEEQEAITRANESLFRFLAASWQLMQQAITTETTVGPNRATRKRLHRAGLLDESVKREVRIITLRRRKEKPVGAEGDGQPVNWSHRWIVSGFWRNQWYPSLGEHRQIWIEEYVKGPPEKPLVIKNTVFKLSR